MAILNTVAYPNEFDKSIYSIFFDEFMNLPTEWDKMGLNIQDAPPGKSYTESELSPVGGLVEIPEGQGIQFDTPEEGNKKTITYIKFGLGLQFTPESIKDDLFGNFKKVPSKAAKSAVNKIETEVADLFNNAFSTTYHTVKDGKAICANDHTTLKSESTIDNYMTAATLSETSLQAMFEYYDDLVDEAGFPLMGKPSRLVVGTALRAEAERLMRTRGVVGSMNNDVNLAGPEGYMRPSLFVSHFFTSDTAYFLTDDTLFDMRLYWKERASMESWDEFYTGAALFKILMRFKVFMWDYKGIAGNPGA